MISRRFPVTFDAPERVFAFYSAAQRRQFANVIRLRDRSITTRFAWNNQIRKDFSDLSLQGTDESTLFSFLSYFRYTMHESITWPDWQGIVRFNAFAKYPLWSFGV